MNDDDVERSFKNKLDLPRWHKSNSFVSSAEIGVWGSCSWSEIDLSSREGGVPGSRDRAWGWLVSLVTVVVADGELSGRVGTLPILTEMSSLKARRSSLCVGRRVVNGKKRVRGSSTKELNQRYNERVI